MKKKSIILAIVLLAGGLTLAQAQSISSLNIFNGNGYEVVNQRMSWEEARREAERRGGKLATITGAEENTFVLSLIMRQGNTDAYWLGGQADSGRRWSWLTGESFSYNNWGNGNPDNYEGRQDKIKMSRDYYTWANPGEWDDENSSNQHGFVIEYPAGAFTQTTDIIVQGNNLAEKLEWLNVFSQSNTSYIIEIRANESIVPQDLRYSGKSGITITLKGIGANRIISPSSEGIMFSIFSGVTLVLDNNITLRRILVSANGGTLVMNNGSAITGATLYGVYDAAVSVSGGVKSSSGTSAAGIFIMNGGTISGGTSYGVNVSGVDIKGTFIMSGGTISGNQGGGVNVNGGIFIMSGGTISGNSRGGVYMTENAGSRGGTFTMSGGTISGNTAQSSGGGVYMVGGIFDMNGGIISGNTAGNGDGGGVFVSRGGVNHGIFTMRNGTISGNTASRNGGGVYVGSLDRYFDRRDIAGYFQMSNGTISGNTARENGGGVCAGGTYGTFIKTGGTITGFASDQRNGNAVKNASGAVQNFRGHAVYATGPKIRQGTAGPEDNLSYSTFYNNRINPPVVNGAWDN